MARLPRLYAPDTPQLAQAELTNPLQENGGGLDAAMFDTVQQWVAEASQQHRVTLHGWCLLPDRLICLCTPAQADSLARMMQALGRKLASRQMAGAVFNGRYRCALVQPGQWILPVLAWMESRPVTARLAPDAEAWPWSSARAHTGSLIPAPAWLHNHPDYWRCGNTPFDRQAAYRQLLHDGLSREQEQRIATALQGQWALGDAAFLERLAGTASRRVQPGKRGRPRKTAAASSR